MKKHKFFSLQYKFFFYFLILSTIPAIVTSILTYRQSSGIIIQKTKDINAQKLNSVAANIDSIMAHANEVSHLILQNVGVRNYLYGSNPDKPADIMNFLVPFAGYNSNICSIHIYGSNGTSLATGDSFTPQELSTRQKSDADKQKGYYAWSTQHLTMGTAYGKTVETLSFIRQYRDIYKPSTQLGYITIDIPSETILNTWQDKLTSPAGIFLVLDENKKVILSNNEEYVHEKIQPSIGKADSLKQIGDYKLKEEFVFNAHSLSNAGWTIVDLTPVNEILTDTQSVFDMFTAVAGGNILLCLGIALLISKRHLKPLRILGELIRDAKHQDFKEYVGRTPNDEIGLLTTEFNKMSHHFEVLMNQVHVAQLKQSEAEFNALQAQINPHFLYNTLDTIYWICRLEHADEASVLVQALGDMFRLSLNKGEGMISLEDELKHLNSYLLIQKMRCKTTVQVEVYVDDNPTLMQAKVIKLVLQPLVENAFVHGVPTNTKQVQIHISVRLDADMVIYDIEDNGAGIEKELLLELNSPNNKVGFGVRNVNERIKVLFGEQYGVAVESIHGKGTTVRVTQPYRPEIAAKE